MKIVKKEKKNWDKPWLGTEVSCIRCECIFSLGLDSQVKKGRYGDYFADCPECKGDCDFEIKPGHPRASKSQLMKIIKSGKTKQKKPRFKKKCKFCGCIFSPEADDKTEEVYNGREDVNCFRCPYCGMLVR